MEQLTFLILNSIFFLPAAVFLIYRHGKIIFQYKKFLLATAILGILCFVVLEQIAVTWGAWGYDNQKTLGIYLGVSVIEMLIWTILVPLIVASVVIISAIKEEKGESLFPFL